MAAGKEGHEDLLDDLRLADDDLAQFMEDLLANVAQPFNGFGCFVSRQCTTPDSGA